MNQSIAMNVRTPMPDLAAITNAAQRSQLNDYQLRNAPMKSELEGLQLQDQIGGQRAMQDYRDATAKGDPAAIEKLNAYPAMQKQIYEAFDGMTGKEFMEAKKRSKAFAKAAQFVGGRVDGTPEQEQRWNASAKVLKDAGMIDDKQFNMMIETGPSDLMLQQALTTDQWVQAYAGKNANTLDDDLTRARIADIGADNARADRKVEPGAKAPNGYRWTDDGKQTYIEGGPADPRVKASQGAGGVTTKMHNDAVAVDQAYNNLNSALDNYEKLIEKTGVTAVPGQDSDAISQSRTNLQLQMKELYNLGVLNGPDLSLMQKMIFDPSVSALNPIDAATKIYGETDLPGAGSVNVGSRATASIARVKDMLKTIRDNKTKGILDANGNFVGKGGAAALPPAAAEDTGEAPVELSEDEANSLIEQALEAVDQGEDRAAVLQELLDMGVDPSMAAEGLSQ